MPVLRLHVEPLEPRSRKGEIDVLPAEFHTLIELILLLVHEAEGCEPGQGDLKAGFDSPVLQYSVVIVDDGAVDGGAVRHDRLFGLRLPQIMAVRLPGSNVGALDVAKLRIHA